MMISGTVRYSITTREPLDESGFFSSFVRSREIILAGTKYIALYLRYIIFSSCYLGISIPSRRREYIHVFCTPRYSNGPEFDQFHRSLQSPVSRLEPRTYLNLMLESIETSRHNFRVVE